MTSLSETSLLAGSSGVSTGYTIDQSIRFDGTTPSYLNKTFGSAGNAKTWTLSFWWKRGVLSSQENARQTLFGAGNGETSSFALYSNHNSATIDGLTVSYTGSSNDVRSTQVFRDVSAWYHVVVKADTTNAIANERFIIYVNGTRIPLDAYSAPSLNSDFYVNYGVATYFGYRVGGGNSQAMDGYLSEIHFIDGTAYGPEFFGELESNGIWIPKEYDGSYGSKGYKIDGRDSSDLGDDESGNGNDFSTSGLDASDQVLDSPTNNHGVFNVLEKNLRYSTTITDGNKKINFSSGSSGWSGTRLGLFRSNGKAYAEFKVNQAYSHTNGDGITVFVANDSSDSNSSVNAGGGTGSAKLEAAYNAIDGSIYDRTSSQGTGTTWNSVNAVIGVYIDFDNGKGWFSKDGTVQTVNGTPNVNNGTNAHFTFTANTPLTVGAGGVHFGTPGILSLQNHVDEWDTTPGGSYTPFSTLAEGEA